MPTTDPNSHPSFLRRWFDAAERRRALSASTFEHPDVQFELTDISPRGVLATGLGLLVVLWIIVLLLYFVFIGYAHYRAVNGGPVPPLIHERSSLPPEPRIQATPRVDFQEFRAREENELHSYRWTDRQKGIAEIPIDDAMRLIVARGIPPQKAPQGLKLSVPQAGTRRTGLEGKVEPEPR